jgi:hypothetical protein
VLKMCGCARQRCTGRTGKVENSSNYSTTEFEGRTVDRRRREVEGERGQEGGKGERE